MVLTFPSTLEALSEAGNLSAVFCTQGSPGNLEELSTCLWMISRYIMKNEKLARERSAVPSESAGQREDPRLKSPGFWQQDHACCDPGPACLPLHLVLCLESGVSTRRTKREAGLSIP